MGPIWCELRPNFVISARCHMDTSRQNVVVTFCLSQKESSSEGSGHTLLKRYFSLSILMKKAACVHLNGPRFDPPALPHITPYCSRIVRLHTMGRRFTLTAGSRRLQLSCDNAQFWLVEPFGGECHSSDEWEMNAARNPFLLQQKRLSTTDTTTLTKAPW